MRKRGSVSDFRHNLLFALIVFCIFCLHVIVYKLSGVSFMKCKTQCAAEFYESSR